MFFKKNFIFLILLSIYSININAEASNCSQWTIISIGGISMAIPTCETVSKPIIKPITPPVNNISSTNNNCAGWVIIPMSGVHSITPLCETVIKTAHDFGAIGDGVTDDTYALLKAFASEGDLNLEGKKYLIDINKPGLSYGLIPSNNKIIKGNGAEIILKPNNLTHYSMIGLVNRRNVKIYDLKLTGDVRNHQGSEGQWGMGFTLKGCINCELHRCEANEMWGDGFYVNGSKEETNEGGGIFNSSARANRRVGLSVSRCKNFTVKDSKFTDTGTIKIINPAYGVDIEPDPDQYDSIDSIKLINIKTENNQCGGLLMVPRHLISSTHPNAIFNVYVEKFVSKNNGNKKYWLCSPLRFVERFSEKILGFTEIKGFEVIHLQSGQVPFRWETMDNSNLEVHATDLNIDGVIQNDYHH